MIRPYVNISNAPNHAINQNHTKRPTRCQIYELGQRINERLFHQRSNDGRIIKYEAEDIIRLLNYVSNKNDIPQSLRVPWGDTSVASNHKNKRYVLWEHEDPNCSNRTNRRYSRAPSYWTKTTIYWTNGCYIKWAPHRNSAGKRVFINRCKQIRLQFNVDNTNILCLDPKFTRNS